MRLVELAIGSEWDDNQDWSKLCDASASAAVNVSPYLVLLQKKVAMEISIKLSDNEEVQKLNNSYRGRDKPTNVLSFPLVDKNTLTSLPGNSGGISEILLGDIILAKTTCQREAEEKEVSFADHVAHLVVHGTLHLLGYDHQDDDEAETMEQLEVQALQTLNIPNPYKEHALKR